MADVIKGTIMGDKALIAALQERVPQISTELSKAVKVLSVKFVRVVKQDKLSGQVLKNRTGHLRGSIRPETETTQNSTTATIYAGGFRAPYGVIHEYGGVIPAHTVVPRFAKALAFTPAGGGDRIVRKLARIPDVRMPERSYMRSTLTEMRDEIVRTMNEAVIKAASGK